VSGLYQDVPADLEVVAVRMDFDAHVPVVVDEV